MSDKEKRSKTAKTTSNILQAIGELIKASGIRRALPRQYKLMTPEGTSTVLGVIDSTGGRVRGNPPRPTGEWLLRVDTPHRGADFNHININPKLTGLGDPHVAIPSSVVQVSKGVAKTAKFMQKVNKVALPVAIALDTVRFGCAVYNDLNRKDGKPKQTVKTGASIAGGWTGGIAGGMGGVKAVTAIGGFIGALFGGAGAIPGAAIGSIVGGILGSIGGRVAGSYGAEALAGTAVSSFFSCFGQFIRSINFLPSPEIHFLFFNIC